MCSARQIKLVYLHQHFSQDRQVTCQYLQSMSNLIPTSFHFFHELMMCLCLLACPTVREKRRTTHTRTMCQRINPSNNHLIFFRSSFLFLLTSTMMMRVMIYYTLHLYLNRITGCFFATDHFTREYCGSVLFVFFIQTKSIAISSFFSFQYSTITGSDD